MTKGRSFRSHNLIVSEAGMANIVNRNITFCDGNFKFLDFVWAYEI